MQLPACSVCCKLLRVSLCLPRSVLCRGLVVPRANILIVCPQGHQPLCPLSTRHCSQWPQATLEACDPQQSPQGRITAVLLSRLTCLLQPARCWDFTMVPPLAKSSSTSHRCTLCLRADCAAAATLRASRLPGLLQ